MGTNKIFFLRVWFYYLVLCITSQSVIGNTIELNQKQLKLREVYTKEIGVKEATGHNDGPRIKEYLANTGLPEGNAWCAAFITTCFIEAGIPAIRSAYSPSWFKPQYLIYVRGKPNNKTPTTGDVGGIWFQDKGRIAHVLFIDEWPFGTAFTNTVEGNTNKDGSREGNQVCRKRRPKAQIHSVSRYIV